MIAIIAFTFFCLLFVLGAGLIIFRHMLLPKIDVKLPPSGARSWSRFRDRNPRSLVAESDTQGMWNIATVTAASAQPDPGLYTLEPYNSSFISTNGFDMDMQRRIVPASPVPKPEMFDSGAFLESILTPDTPPNDENTFSNSHGTSQAPAE